MIIFYKATLTSQSHENSYIAQIYLLACRVIIITVSDSGHCCCGVCYGFMCGLSSSIYPLCLLVLYQLKRKKKLRAFYRHAHVKETTTAADPYTGKIRLKFRKSTHVRIICWLGIETPVQLVFFRKLPAFFKGKIPAVCVFVFVFVRGS